MIKTDSRKAENREKLQEIADECGDLYLTEMLWDMFDDLSTKNQEKYLRRAREIADRVFKHGS